MSIKRKVIKTLGDSLVKSEEKYVNAILVKNIHGNSLSENSLRILATDSAHAENMAKILMQSKTELGIKSMSIIERALDLPIKYNLNLQYSRSLLLQLETRTLLQSTSVFNQEGSRLRLQEAVGYTRSERIVIDFSSPNIAKPFHFGHLKSTILGNYLANLNQYLGSQVTKLNFIGDWGTQYGLLSLGLDEFVAKTEGESLEEKLGESPLKRLLDIYVNANEKGSTDDAFYNNARHRLLALDSSGDTEHLKTWQTIRNLSLKELDRSYKRLGIEFDVYECESNYAKESIKLVDHMIGSKIATRKNDGVVTIQVEKNGRYYEVPIMKSDGASLYLTRDVCAAINRMVSKNFDKMFYVVGSDQEKHFHSLGQIIELLGYDWKNRLKHVKMGKVLGISSRTSNTGNKLLLSDIIDEATKHYIESTRNTVTSKVKSDDELSLVGEQLALSSLFVYDMRNMRTCNYNFDWALVMHTGSRSGINLQTTFARLASLIERASNVGLMVDCNMEELELDVDAICCVEAVNLMSDLQELETALHVSYLTLDPFPLVSYALQLCKSVNRARQSERLWVLGEPEVGKAMTRLHLFKCAHSVLEFIIRLIGLKPLVRV